MSIKFACGCGKAYKVPEKFSGKRVKCKQCGEPIRVPSQSEKGVQSQRAAAVSQRSVMGSERVSSKSGKSSKRSSRSSSRSSSKSGRSAKPAKKAKAGSDTDEFEAVDLVSGNELKKFQSKKEEDFSRGTGRLTYYEDGKPVKAFRLNKKESAVGRADSCGICLPLASVSREHATIEYKLGTFILTDQSSSNGMMINGRRVRRASLKSGDIIQFGQAILRIDC